MEVEKALLREKSIFFCEPIISETLIAENDDCCNHSEAFKVLVEKDLPCNELCNEEKLCWVRSEMIGRDAEFDTPFGRRQLVYADHTASGRSLHYSENFIIKHLLPFYGNTHTCDSYVGSRTTEILHEATQYIKKCLGGGEDDAIIFCGSGTTSAIKKLQEVMAIAVPSILRERVINTMRMEERWVVFVGPYEHHSNLLSWRQSLAQVIEIGLDDDGLLDMDALKLQLEAYKDTNRPILGSFSACSNVTGIYSDTRAISQLLHQYNGFACFDFAASGPYVEIDMKSGESDGYDAVFLSPHKFLGGPDSPGVLLMNKSLYKLGSSAPSICGGGTVDYVNGFDEKDTLYMRNIEERENAGTPPIIQTVRAALAFWVKDYIGYHEIENREQFFIHKALERLNSNPNIGILGNTRAKRQAILSFVIYCTNNSSLSSSSYCAEDDDNKENVKELLDLWAETGNKRGKLVHGPFVATLLNDLFGIQARGGCACAGPYGHKLLNINKSQSLAVRSAIQQGYVGVKPGWTRVSFPYYMEEEDFEYILTAIEFVAAYGQRFLPLYSFNLRSGRWRVRAEKLEAMMVKEKDNNFRKILEDANSGVNARSGYEVGEVGILGNKSYYLHLAKYMADCINKFTYQDTVKENMDYNVINFNIALKNGLDRLILPFELRTGRMTSSLISKNYKFQEYAINGASSVGCSKSNEFMWLKKVLLCCHLGNK